MARGQYRLHRTQKLSETPPPESWQPILDKHFAIVQRLTHEFAHQLDQLDGAADGAPILKNRSAYASWAKVLSADYDRLCEITEHGKRDVIDRYGTTNPAEFFAVATESFFEKPRQLHKKHPKLYDELRSYYNLNPLDWVD